ncbi:MAG: carbohydrate ABC transporter substrate-binding protein [Oscillospiraceae bacterium]|nr:carbohydrate ABC transporter substrate-binding protein [Oscillospiraceae bacterium]
MKKSICAMLILALLCPLFAGCHGAKERVAFEVPDNFDPTVTHELTFWAKSDTNIVQVNTNKKAIADFEALYPNISVTMKQYTNYDDIYNDVITNLATDTTPNICITYPDHIATYKQSENAVVALDDLFADEKFGFGGSEVLFDAPTVEQIIPQFLQECTLEGYYYAVPFMRSTEACYINKNLVEALGYELPEMLTWDFVWEVSEAAMAKNEDGTYVANGQNVLIPFIYKSTDNMMIQMLKQKGAGYSTDAGDIHIFNDTTKQLLYTIAEHVKTRAFSTFKISSYPGNFLNAGQCIFAIDSTAGATWLGSHAPLVDIPEENLVEFETVVMPIPQFDTENPQMISQGPSICIFNKEDPQEVLASWLFVQYLLTNEVQIAYSQTEGYVPVTSKAQQSDEYQDYLSRAGEDNDLYYDVKIAASKLLLENTEYTFVTPVFNGSVSLRNAAGQMIENVAKSVRRKQEVNEEYIANLYSEMTSLYRLDQIQVDGQWKMDLGPLPTQSVILLSVLGVTWLGIVAFAIGKRRKSK